MASTVLKRTIFVERDKDGYFRFQDWALSLTTLGAMAEPFSPDLRAETGSPETDFDPTDDIALITDIQQVDSNLLPTLLSGGGAVTMGGVTRCRTGR